MTYEPPIGEILFAMEEIACWREGLDDVACEFTASELALMLEQAGQLAKGTIAPLNQPSDRSPATWHDGAVTMPAGWKEAYRLWTEAGWNGISLPDEFGGMGLPAIFGAATMEMLTSACFAMGTLPVLAQGAVVALDAHAGDELKRLYLPKLVSGEWTATMDLTEPQGGSDLGVLRSTAVPAGDGTFRIRGEKIFITFGDHDLTENIVHLVLARLPDAPEGTKGISMFLVPKFIPNPDGSPGVRNDVECAGIEHKLGIRSSPTCTLVYGPRGGAIGWLAGEANRGLASMFAMMNRARLAIGLQGVAVAERALQQATDYARQRVQGKVPGGRAGEPIIRHPDVCRMLMTMSARTAAARALTYRAAAEIDRARYAGEQNRRDEANAFAGLLTPLAKAFATDAGVEVASLGIQVHGGIGYVEETGAAQHWRDARIGPIYEGTNGIQAIDFVTRRVVLDGGRAAGLLLSEIGRLGMRAQACPHPGFEDMGRELARAHRALDEATGWVLDGSRTSEQRLSTASAYLDLFGLVLGGALLAKGALASLRDAAAGDGSPDDERRILIARFYAGSILTGADGLARSVTGSADIVAAARARFG